MFTVTRQCQFPDGANVVEVSVGGLDFCNADALSERYSGEFQTFSDPREAVNVAIEIARNWRKDSGKRISIGVGSTHGMTMPFDSGTQADAIKWASEVWESLPKCSGCGEAMQSATWHANEWDGLDYCSEPCATLAAEFEAEENARITAEENSDTEEN